MFSKVGSSAYQNEYYRILLLVFERKLIRNFCEKFVLTLTAKIKFVKIK